MAQVYFIKLAELSKLERIMPQFSEPLALKTHFGEEGCTTNIPASYVKQISCYTTVKPTLVETSVLYRSARRRAAGHKEVALKHGFDFAPLDFLDGEEGDEDMKVGIDGKHFKTCFLAAGLEKYNSLLVISHFKGHGGCGFGGALKNLGMGLAARRGKLAMHSSIKHNIKGEKCVSCGACIDHCPVNAIKWNEAGKAEIDQGVCLSCSKCISVCPSGAVRIPWGSTGKMALAERIAEYAAAAHKGKNCFFINFLINITADCDCNDQPMEIITPDIGVLASPDPVAIDQASLDLLIKQYPAFKDFGGETQIKRAEELGLGAANYQLEN